MLLMFDSIKKDVINPWRKWLLFQRLFSLFHRPCLLRDIPVLLFLTTEENHDPVTLTAIIFLTHKSGILLYTPYSCAARSLLFPCGGGLVATYW